MLPSNLELTGRSVEDWFQVPNFSGKWKVDVPEFVPNDSPVSDEVFIKCFVVIEYFKWVALILNFFIEIISTNFQPGFLAVVHISPVEIPLEFWFPLIITFCL